MNTRLVCINTGYVAPLATPKSFAPFAPSEAARKQAKSRNKSPYRGGDSDKDEPEGFDPSARLDVVSYLRSRKSEVAAFSALRESDDDDSQETLAIETTSFEIE